jgi:ribonuclease D
MRSNNGSRQPAAHGSDEESATLHELSLYRVEPAEAWRRLKGRRLDAAALRCAHARWARAACDGRNLRRWVLPDAAIHELAQRRPQNREQLMRLVTVPRGTAERAADAILAAVGSAADETVERDVENSLRPGTEQLRRQKLLQKRLTVLAGELGMQPEVLATRRELAALRGSRPLTVLSGWRRRSSGRCSPRYRGLSSEGLP